MIEVLNMMVGQEVFVIASDEQSHNAADTSREFHICDSIEDLREKMKDLEVQDVDELRVVHGVLTHAAALPPDLKDRTAFVLVASPLDDEDGFMVESGDTLEHVEESVRELIEHGIGYCYDLEIEQIFVVYGYELTIVLSINDDDIDEETLDSCHQVADAAESVFDQNKLEIEK